VTIDAVRPNNHRRAFDLELSDERRLSFPYARLKPMPTSSNRVCEARPDPELGREAITYSLENGSTGDLHLDSILHYNSDPDYLRDLLVYRLTLEVEERVRSSGLSKRELVRRLGTSASQLYLLLDSANYGKTLDQLVRLLYILGYEVEFDIRSRAASAAPVGESVGKPAPAAGQAGGRGSRTKR
jgi:hypothetical protein